MKVLEKVITAKTQGRLLIFLQCYVSTKAYMYEVVDINTGEKFYSVFRNGPQFAMRLEMFPTIINTTNWIWKKSTYKEALELFKQLSK